jgi:hypothetical protein
MPQSVLNVCVAKYRAGVGTIPRSITSQPSLIMPCFKKLDIFGLEFLPSLPTIISDLLLFLASLAIATPILVTTFSLRSSKAIKFQFFSLLVHLILYEILRSYFLVCFCKAMIILPFLF